jgi:outer membrane lipoprotein carrier protein
MLILVPAARAVPVEEIVRQVQNRYDTTKDFTAHVQQELIVASTGQTLTATGEVAFKRPGKMNWKLEGPDEQLIVADGTVLWLYQKEEQQVLKAPFQSAFRSTTPISFLTGVGRITDDFEVTLAGIGEHEVYLDLRPRRTDAEFGRLRLIINTSTSDIIGAEVRDPVGNVTKLRFTELRRNVGLPDSRFTFAVPPGVDIIEVPIGY